MDLVNVLIGVAAGVVYAFLGYSAQSESFNWRKFLRTVAFATLASLGLNVSGLTFDVYTSSLEPLAVTVLLQKLIDTAAAQKKG
ncbi:MAG: hypothetical protein QXH20_02505 [Candidatus Bathyarchaeia archaeon]